MQADTRRLRKKLVLEIWSDRPVRAKRGYIDENHPAVLAKLKPPPPPELTEPDLPF